MLQLKPNQGSKADVKILKKLAILDSGMRQIFRTFAPYSTIGGKMKSIAKTN